MSAAQAVAQIGNNAACWRLLLGDLSALGVTNYGTIEAIAAQLAIAASGTAAVIGQINIETARLDSAPPAATLPLAVVQLTASVTAVKAAVDGAANVVGVVIQPDIEQTAAAMDVVLTNELANTMNVANAALFGSAPAADLGVAFGAYQILHATLKTAVDAGAELVVTGSTLGNALATAQNTQLSLAGQLGNTNTAAANFNAAAAVNADLNSALNSITAYANFVSTGSGAGAYGMFGALRTYLATKQGAARPIGNYPAQLAPLGAASWEDILSYVNNAL